MFLQTKLSLELECFFNFFTGVKRHLSIFTKTMAFFSCVEDVQKVLKNAKKLCDERTKAALKTIESAFSFVSSVADNAVLLSLMLITDYSLYKTARMVKDTAALFRNIFAISVFAIILKRPKSRQKTKAGKCKTKSIDEDRPKGMLYDVAAVSLHTLSLLTILRIIPMHCKLITCILDITRFSIKIRKHLANIEKA